MYLSVFFFFKQKTAYELRISDWSSDVCSSDLRDRASRDRRGNEILAVDAGALERAEHRAGRDLAVIDRETGDGGGVARAGERAEPHWPAAAFSAGDFHRSGNSSETALSLFMEGITPSCGPVRWLTQTGKRR